MPFPMHVTVLRPMTLSAMLAAPLVYAGEPPQPDRPVGPAALDQAAANVASPAQFDSTIARVNELADGWAWFARR